MVASAGIAYFNAIQDENFNEYLQESRKVNEDAGIELARLTSSYIQSSNGSMIFIASLLGWNPVRI